MISQTTDLIGATRPSLFSQGNQALRDQRFDLAILRYLDAMQQSPSMSTIVADNLAYAKRRYRQVRKSSDRLRVAVCGGELAHNAAGRVHTLAHLYSTFADVEIIGSLFPEYGDRIWEPIRNTAIPIHSFVVEQPGNFLAQAERLVRAHPYDLVHLSKPRAAAIFFGALYKLIWDALVFIDIDDEELAFVGCDQPIGIAAYRNEFGALPDLQQLDGPAWTRLAVGLADGFDAITVSNPELQRRYGGSIIRHARDERLYQPSPEQRRRSRDHLGIPLDKKVVLFFGTPREHKGLIETAEAIAALGRNDVVFAVVGTFPDPSLKQRLLRKPGVDFYFLGNQPIARVPELVAAGDYCVLLQDPTDPVAKFQAPAKLSDALGMGLTVLCSEVAALSDLAARGAWINVPPGRLTQALSEALRAEPYAPLAREVFLDSLSFAANAPILRSLVESATGWSVPRPSLSPLLAQLVLEHPGFAPLRPLVHASSTVAAEGVTIVIPTLDAAALLDRLLSGFFSVNTHWPVEILVVDHGSADNTRSVVSKYTDRGVRFIPRGRNHSFSSSCNFGARRARYPVLLFLNNDIIFTADVLPAAFARLQDPVIGAVGVRLNDHPGSAAATLPTTVQHAGIHFVWNDRRGYHQPEQIRHLAAACSEQPRSGFVSAVTGAFLLCRKPDFAALNGFSEDYDYGLEDVDFCLRLGTELNLRCWCINDLALAHVEGATRKRGPQQLIHERTERNHRVFKGRWAPHLHALVTAPPESPSRSGTAGNRDSSAVKGYVERLADGVIIGWAARLDDDSALDIAVYIDETRIAVCRAELPRDDLRRAGIREGRHGFSTLVPKGLFDGHEHTVEVRLADGTPIPHGQSKRRLLLPVGGAARPFRREITGARACAAGQPTVLVCAHVVGATLYGSERSFLDILDGFLAIGINAIVTVPGAGNSEYLQALCARACKVLVMDYGWWTRDRQVNEKAVTNFAEIIAAERVSAVHVNTIMLREPLQAARRQGVPAVVHVRELIFHDVALLNKIGESAESIVAQVLESVDFVISNSAANARCYNKPGHTYVVPNAVDLDAFEMEHPLPSECVNIALISSNLPKKGIHDFVVVAGLLEHRVPHARFLLIGPYNEHTRALRAGQEAGTVPRNVLFPGYMANPVDAIAQANIIVNLSNFQESFGRTITEAMAGGRPTVVYDWGALPELVLDGATGYVVPFGDTAAVAARIARLCDQPRLLVAMGRAALRRAQSSYGKASFAAALQRAYRDILLSTPLPANQGSVATLPSQTDSLPAERELHIAYFVWHFPVPSETFVLNELRYLVEHGFDVMVFCRQSPYKDFTPDFPIRWERVTSPEDLARRLREAGRTLLHAHFTYPTVTEFAWPACQQADLPFTFIAHAQDIFRHDNDVKNRIAEIVRSPHCQRVLVLGRFHLQYLVERGVPRHKIVINSNGIDLRVFPFAGGLERYARPVRRICAVQRWVEKKGLSLLVQAAPALAVLGIEINIYGYGPEAEALSALAEQQGAPNLTLHGPLDNRTELLGILSEHDLFVAPCVRAQNGDMDGIPTVLMEAMASGLPVAATPIASIPDLIRDGVSGLLFESQSVDAIVAAVKAFAAMPPLRREAMAREARRTVESTYDVNLLQARLVRLWMNKSIDIVIVSWNNLADLQEVVRRVQYFTSMPHRLIIHDNASEEPVAAYLRRLAADHDNVTVIFAERNTMVGPGTNSALAVGTAEFAVYLCAKEGYVLRSQWERPLVEYMTANPDVGIAGTLCYSPSYMTGKQYVEAHPEFSRFRRQDFAHNNPERPFRHVQGGLFVLRRRMYEEIGGFSELVPHNHTDTEYSYYAEASGWQLGQAPGCVALFKLSRPGLLSRVDETIASIHPGDEGCRAVLDAVSSGQGFLCNVCERHDLDCGQGYDQVICKHCGSVEESRTLWRFLAESTLTFRRLPALAVNLHPASLAFWREQFQGRQISLATLLTELRDMGQTPSATGRTRLVYLNNTFSGAEDDQIPILIEARRLLVDDGVLLVRVDWEDGREAWHPRDVSAFLDRHGFRWLGEKRYASVVNRFDWTPLLEYCKR